MLLFDAETAGNAAVEAKVRRLDQKPRAQDPAEHRYAVVAGLETLSKAAGQADGNSIAIIIIDIQTARGLDDPQ